MRLDGQSASMSWRIRGPSSSLEGRPLSRAKSGIRQHPYRRAPQAPVPSAARLPVSRSAALSNGNGAQTAVAPGTLSANGHLMPGSGANSELLQLMKKVDPQNAAVQLHQVDSGHQQVSDITAINSWTEGATPAEIVWAPGKSAAQIAIALQRTSQEGKAALAARVTPEVFHEVRTLLPEVKYNIAARALTVAPTSRKQERLPGTVAILSAGEEEDNVAEECKAASVALGCYAYRLASAVVEGVPSISAAVQSADVVVVVAGRDGALPAMVASQVQAPVVAIPTTASNGVVASSPGISVVNTDNGLGAAVFAARILRAASRLRRPAP